MTARKKAKKQALPHYGGRQVKGTESEQPMVSAIPETKVEEEDYTAGFTQWMVDGDRFVPMTITVPTLPPGDYNIRYDRTFDKHVLAIRKPILENLLHLPMKEFGEVLDDIRKFWESREKYDEYGFVYKRGILLYGAPGCGKSSLIALMSSELVDEQGGIILNIATSDDILAFDEIMKGIREIEPERRVIAVVEDIDNFVTDGKNVEITSKLLNMLDGKLQFDNVVIIATTNYPEDLEERISNRPSRFDLRREIGPPKMRAREFYLKSKLKPKDLKKLDIEKTLRDTAGFTIDHLKEFVCMTFVHGHDYDTALEEVKSMISTPILKNKSVKGNDKIGFGNSDISDDDDREKK